MNTIVSPAEARLTQVSINEQRAQSALNKLNAIYEDLTKQNLGNNHNLEMAIHNTRELVDYFQAQREVISSYLQRKKDNETATTKI